MIDKEYIKGYSRGYKERAIIINKLIDDLLKSEAESDNYNGLSNESVNILRKEVNNE